MRAINATIKERIFSWTAEYDISTPVGNYYARKAYFSLTDKIRLQRQEEDDRAIVRINGLLSFFACRHEFLFADGRTYQFRREKFWRGVYACHGAEGTYRLYTHKGLRSSIFLNERQIAAVTNNRFVLLKGNRHDIQLDSDANLLLILCLVLAVNSSSDSDSDGATLTIDFGNPFEDRPFDESWKPR